MRILFSRFSRTFKEFLEIKIIRISLSFSFSFFSPLLLTLSSIGSLLLSLSQSLSLTHSLSLATLILSQGEVRGEAHLCNLSSHPLYSPHYVISFFILLHLLLLHFPLLFLLECARASKGKRTEEKPSVLPLSLFLALLRRKRIFCHEETHVTLSHEREACACSLSSRVLLELSLQPFVARGEAHLILLLSISTSLFFFFSSFFFSSFSPSPRLLLSLFQIFCVHPKDRERTRTSACASRPSLESRKRGEKGERREKRECKWKLFFSFSGWPMVWLEQFWPECFEQSK